jgi:hypothetical protein
LSKSKSLGPNRAEAVVFAGFLVADCYFTLLIALLPPECRVPFAPLWARFEPTVEL